MAFDRVWHAGLLHNLKSYGISCQIFGPISSFLSIRWLWLVLCRKSSWEYPVNVGVPQGSILGPTLSLRYINDILDNVICSSAISTGDTALYCKCDQVSYMWQQLKLAAELESDIQSTVDWGRKCFVDFNAGKAPLVSFDILITLVLLIWKWMGLFLRKNHLLRCWSFYSILNCIGALILSLIAKTASEKIGTMICFMKFLSPEVAQYLCKSTIYIRPCMEYCCHIWAGAPSCYLEMLDSYKKGYIGLLVPSLAASLQPLVHCRIVPSLCLFYRYGLVHFHLNWLNWFHYLVLKGGLLVIQIDCMLTLSPFLDIRMFTSTVSFFAQLDSAILYLKILSFDLWSKWL